MIAGIAVDTLSLGLLVGRLTLGILMAAHGSQKLFGWFGGHGLDGTGGFFESIGWRPGRVFALAAGMGEVISGVLVALGFLGPIGPALMIAVMVVAAIGLHWRNGLFATNNGIELPLLYLVGALVIALTGHGEYSIDAALGLAGLWSMELTWLVLGLGFLAGAVSLLVRRPPEIGAPTDAEPA